MDEILFKKSEKYNELCTIFLNIRKVHGKIPPAAMGKSRKQIFNPL